LSHAMVKLFHHVLFSRVLEQVNDQEMRDRKRNHTVKDSCYHKEKGAGSKQVKVDLAGKWSVE